MAPPLSLRPRPIRWNRSTNCAPSAGEARAVKAAHLGDIYPWHMAEQLRTTADRIVECLENEGVPHVFGIPGEENIRLIEALSEYSVLYALTKHKEGAYIMAENY